MKRKWTARCVLAGASVLWGVAAHAPPGRGQESKVSRQVARAAAATAERDFGRAEREWRRVIALDPRSAAAHHNLGIVYYLIRQYSEAETTLSQALALDPNLANARVLLGASLARQGKLERAATELERALKARLSDSAEKTARIALHEVWTARENYTRALEVLSPLAAKYPEDVEIPYALGQTHLQLASENFRRMAAVDPESHRVHQVLAESLAKQGLYHDAIREYRRGLERRPDLPGIHYQIGLLYWKNETTPDGENAALREFQQELEINPHDAWSEYRLGQILWKRRDGDQAAAHFRRALERDTKLVPARLGLARALEADGHPDEAQRQLETCAQLAPQNAAVHYRLAQFYKRRGNETAAAEAMKKFEQVQAERRDTRRELEKALRTVAEPENIDELEP